MCVNDCRAFGSLQHAVPRKNECSMGKGTFYHYEGRTVLSHTGDDDGICCGLEAERCAEESCAKARLSPPMSRKKEERTTPRVKLGTRPEICSIILLDYKIFFAISVHLDTYS